MVAGAEVAVLVAVVDAGSDPTALCCGDGQMFWVAASQVREGKRRRAERKHRMVVRSLKQFVTETWPGRMQRVDRSCA